MPRPAYLWLLVPLLCTACASSKRAPTPVTVTVVKPKPSEPPAVVRWAELTEELAAELRAAGPSCSGVARTLTTFVGAHGAELKSTYQALAAWEQGSADQVVARFYDKLFPAVEVRIDAGVRCKHDPPTVEAFDRFFAAAGLDLR